VTPKKPIPEIGDSDYRSKEEDIRYQRKLEERKAFAALVAAEIVKQTPPPAHICQFPQSVVELLSDANIVALLRDMARAYANNQETRKTIKGLVLARIVDVSMGVIITLLVLGFVAWLKQIWPANV
jgi:hypothetical protein